MEKSDETSHTNKKKGPDADKIEVDVDKMLDGLRKQIIDIYKTQFAQTEVSGKKTIDLLNVGEHFKYFNKLNYIGNRNKGPQGHENYQKPAYSGPRMGDCRGEGPLPRL